MSCYLWSGPGLFSFSLGIIAPLDSIVWDWIGLGLVLVV